MEKEDHAYGGECKWKDGKKLWNVRNANSLPFPPRKKEKDDGNGRRDGGNGHRR